MTAKSERRKRKKATGSWDGYLAAPWPRGKTIHMYFLAFSNSFSEGRIHYLLPQYQFRG
jgi:hypothetical protein